MPQEPRSCISYPQPPTAAKRPNTSLDFTKTPPELPQSNANTQSLESILKGKVIKEFVPQAQKEQKASEPTKLAYETAKSKPSAPPPIPKPPMLVPAPSTTTTGAITTAAASYKAASAAALQAAATNKTSAAASKAAAISTMEPTRSSRNSFPLDSSRRILCA